MITVNILTDRSNIETRIPLCEALAREWGCKIAPQYLGIPLLWWDHFNNMDGTNLNNKRGTNFLGSQSFLHKFYLFIAQEGADIVGAMPIVSYAVKIPGEKEELRVFTFPGDYQLISCQDFIVSPGKSTEVIKAFVNSLIGSLENSNDLIILPYLPERSSSVTELKHHLTKISKDGFNCSFAKTGRRGGVRPWTIEAILSCLRQYSNKTSFCSLNEEINRLIDELNACPRMKLLFPQPRKTLEEKTRKFIENISDAPAMRDMTEVLISLLSDSPIIYPYISLSESPESYMMTMSKGTRRYFRRYKKGFEKNGGYFEKITSSDLNEQDIEDYLGLHRLRWGDSSASLRNEQTYNFHKDLCRKLASDGYICIFFANYDGKRIATHSCIDILNHREGYITGRNPAYDNTRASRLLYLETIIDAIRSGLETYDLGHGWFAYKTSFTKTYAQTLNFFISPKVQVLDLAKLYLGYEVMTALQSLG